METVLITMASCLALTLVTECGLAAVVFGVKDASSMSIVAAAQLLTNPIVVGVCSVLLPIALVSNNVDANTYTLVMWSCLIVFEILAFAAEGFVYSKTGFNSPFKMSFVLNSISFFAGVAGSLALTLLT